MAFLAQYVLHFRFEVFLRIENYITMVAMDIFDRFLFAYTIGTHIILVTMSITLIVLISIAEFIGIRRGDQHYMVLSERLTKVFVISFGVGTASGIVMAVEMINLFPAFMTLVASTGAIALFYAEVFAFFLETFALVIYVYYRNAFSGKYTHWVFSVFIALGSIGSAVFITMVNAWMNSPNGFNFAEFIAMGQVTGVNPWAPFITPTTFAQVAHVITTTVFTGAMMVGAYFAYKYLKTNDSDGKAFYTKGLKLTGIVSIVGIILSGATGSHEMGTLLTSQPLKYAALDLNYLPGTNLPERLFGFLQNGNYVWGIEVPNVQSLLAYFETGIKELPGLTQYPVSDWPPLYIHTSFDVMVTGGLLLGLFLFIMALMWIMRRNPLGSRFMLYSQGILGILALVVYELGWMTDEVGRQPWIVYNVMRTDAAANLTPSLFVPGLLIVVFYAILIPLTFYFFARVFNARSLSDDLSGKEAKGGVNY